MAIDLRYTDAFERRHIGPSEAELAQMLSALGAASLDALTDEIVPPAIRADAPLDLPPALSEYELLERVRALGARNQLWRSYIGMGYHDTVTPPVIQRNVFENPGWYTQYTPYQAEIAQGRLEALLNYQTMVIDLTGLPVANASLLDEGTAAAEAMMLLQRLPETRGRRRFFVSEACHPQTQAVVAGRAAPLGIEVVVGDHRTFAWDASCFGALVQHPASDGAVYDYHDFCDAAHAAGAFVVAAADLLSLAVLTPPGAFGADIAVGNTQRFGVPLGYGGPHAAYFAVREAFKRQTPGRIIGVSVDADGQPALRMALQTREQHIRREKATSNICTAQVLLAVMAGMYAVYHGPEGLRRIAERVHGLARVLAAGLRGAGFRLRHDDFFDTLRVDVGDRTEEILRRAAERRINLRRFDDGSLGVALGEPVSAADLDALLGAFGTEATAADLAADLEPGYHGPLARTSAYLQHPVFERYHSETEMMRYLQRLASRDLSLTTSMIPLGSCTMKLNAAAELLPVTAPAFSRLHPFVPAEQAEGYAVLIRELEAWLAEITGFAAVSLQPNSGASGEYAGLLVIRAYHARRGDAGRTVCLIPESAHGTNPASAVMAGMQVVIVKTDARGNVDLADLEQKAEQHADRLAALMITYPSTHGVYERGIRDLCEAVHRRGGQVYMDGANMNAQVGLCRPGDFGADVCHLNLHKTFAIPHGGGGPGVGPICAAAHLAPFLPGHPVRPTGGEAAIAPVAAAPYGSANVLLISWAYIAMMGAEGLRRATQVAMLNANYLARRLEAHYPVLYRGRTGRVAHEFILDMRPFKASADVTERDIAKRLMDYGYHAPTVSFPVAGTLMIEPTESESKEELDRFAEAMIAIREEIREIEQGRMDRQDNPLKNAPHTAAFVAADGWQAGYSRTAAAFPLGETGRKFWPSVRRIDDAYGDRNLICACPSIELYADAAV